MTMSPGPFAPDEIAEDLGSTPGPDAAEAWAAARALERAMPADPPRPSVEFSSRVMAALADEPPPHAAGFLAGLWARPGIAGLVASTRQAWNTAFASGARPMRVRLSAMAYVLAILIAASSLTGVAAFGAAGALGLLSGDRSPTPTVVGPSPAPSPSAVEAPSESPEGSESPEPSGSEDPDESGEPGSPGAGVTDAPSATHAPGATDDHGHDSPEPSDDTRGPGQTPRPSLPKPSESPH